MANNKTNYFENAVLKSWFNNEAILGIGDAGGILPSATAGSVFVALFTASPTEEGLFTNECVGTAGGDYEGYTRIAVPRTAGGWTVNAFVPATDSNTVENAGLIGFPQATAGSTGAVITHAAICKSLSGTSTTEMLIHGKLTGSGLTVSSGVTPQFGAGNIIFEEF